MIQSQATNKQSRMTSKNSRMLLRIQPVAGMLPVSGNTRKPHTADAAFQDLQGLPAPAVGRPPAGKGNCPAAHKGLVVAPLPVGPSPEPPAACVLAERAMTAVRAGDRCLCLCCACCCWS